MSRTATSHLESLNDGREVYINGERITNHVEHPAFRHSVHSAARMYDYIHEPRNAERLTFRSPKTGERISKMWMLPTSHAELVDRRKALEAWSELSCGFFGRSPDHVASALCGMYMGLPLFEQHGKQRAAALASYYEYARDSDLYLTYVIVNPQADRSKGASEQADEFLVAGVVDEDHEGITVKGAKMLGTACPMANEVMVAAIQPLKAGDEKYSFTAMVPLNAKGLKLLSRKSYEQSAVSKFDNPLSSSFDENDAVLYFDEVKIPWDRVFVHNDTKMASAQWHDIPTHCYQNYQCQVRLVTKMRFLLGLTRKIAETNGVIAFPAVRETLGQMAAEVSMVEGMLEAMEASGKQYGQYFVPSAERLYASNVLTQQLYPNFILKMRELAGGGLIMLPSAVADMLDADAAALIRKTQMSPATDAHGRVKLFKLAWDAIGSEFGSRHVQYEMFYSGANMVTRGHAYRTYDWNKALGLVDSFMSTYDLEGQLAPVQVAKAA